MTEPQQNVMQIGILRLYVKDLSFESPQAPLIFRKQFQPEIKLDVSVRPRRVQETLFEVVLHLNIEAKEGGEVGFLIEIEQAGLFDVKAPEGPQLDHVLKVFCPTTLFPYARQAIDAALNQGGFPPLMLAPINFEALIKRGASN